MWLISVKETCDVLNFLLPTDIINDVRASFMGKVNCDISYLAQAPLYQWVLNDFSEETTFVGQKLQRTDGLLSDLFLLVILIHSH